MDRRGRGRSGMSDKEILEKAIFKAIDNGWDGHNERRIVHNIFDRSYVEVQYDEPLRGIMEQIWSARIVPSIIFDHEFAKALWGEAFIVSHAVNSIGQHGSWHSPEWQHRLQQMVIAEDPIKYLGEHM